MSRLLRFVLVLLILAAAAAVVGRGYLLGRVDSPYRGFEGDEAFIEIPQGLGVNAIASRLASAGIVRDPWSFRIAVWYSGAGRSLKAGEYRFADAPAKAAMGLEATIRPASSRALMSVLISSSSIM